MKLKGLDLIFYWVVTAFSCGNRNVLLSDSWSRYGHMIDNVVLIVTGTLHERDVQELLEKCHPLGMFDRYFHPILVPSIFAKKLSRPVHNLSYTIMLRFLLLSSALLPWQLHRICGSCTDWCLLTHHLLHTSLSALHQRYRLVVHAWLTPPFLYFFCPSFFFSFFFSFPVGGSSLFGFFCYCMIDTSALLILENNSNEWRFMFDQKNYRTDIIS